ncbi:MAG TPA: ferritin-like domain-containing protein [Longimicrobiaceae bacterium]|nr:ferritin-like domain-containing protein [Longimicrobiaceae bacterium]
MDTQTTGQTEARTPETSEVLDALNDLLQLDHDAIGAYDIAIERLQDRDHANQIAGFRLDHERHIRDLNEAIARLGGTPMNEPHATGPFKQALQSLGGLAGDKGLLIAWRVNELQVRTKYDTYAARAVHWPDDLKRLVDRNALDEERHYEWVTQVLDKMGVPTAEGLEQDAATKLRERSAGPGVVDTLRERAGDLAATARERVGDLAEGARERVSDLAEGARERVGGLAGGARERAGDLAGGARERLGGVAGGARESVAGGLEAAANRISHLVGGQDGEGGRMAGVANRLAGGIEGTARYVREGNLEELQTGFEEQVRRSPVQTLLVAALAGFVIGRILR